MNNFKSYYGKRTIGPLHKNFSTIVGPNGSGKSNLIECLLFVFGKRAKKMRVSTNIGDLIHNSSNHTNELSAYVEIVFQTIVDFVNDDNYFEVVDGSMFTVKREIKRSSVGARTATSNYFISNEKKTFAEVQDFLNHEHQIDLDHDRFLILQGEVESISMMPSKGANPNETGLLEYLEDIIGSSKYTEQVEGLKVTLEEKREEKIEKQNQVNMLKESISSMKEEKDITINMMKIESNFSKLMLLKDYANLGRVKESMVIIERSKTDVSFSL
jgi:structural maintenance of chromosome 4